MPATPTILWFRQDLRLQDNPALNAAIARGGAVVPVYIWDEAGEGRWAPGGAARAWLRRSLAALDASLRERASRLVLARGDSAAVLGEIVRATGAGAVYLNRRYEPQAMARDARVESELTRAGVEVKYFNSALLHEPPAVANKQGRPFQVFGAFWRHCLTLPVSAPGKLNPVNLAVPAEWPRGPKLDELNLLPPVGPDLRAGRGVMEISTAPPEVGPYHTGLSDAGWQPGEAGAQARLRAFVSRSMDDYAEQRDYPACNGTSILSPHLHFGEIGPRQIWAVVRARSRESGVFPPSEGARVFLVELGWREFAHHLLFHFPRTAEQPLRAEFAGFPWADDPGGTKFRAWQRGETGYPIVDAGMRQLAQTGWMHNRVRMIAASFLVKHLRLSWTEGAAWFWESLVDADLANNTLGWQWIAGCGGDAAPYFRIFAPVLQGTKFDQEGDYVRRWVPELARLPAPHIHAPWQAPMDVLARAGVRLGENYPRPVVEHAAARAEALAAFRAMKERMTI